MSDVTGIKTRGIFRNTFHTERCQLLPSESMTSEICHQLIIHSVCPLNPLLTESAMAFAGREAAPPTLCLLAACSALAIGNSQTAVFSLDNSAGVHICDMALSLSLSSRGAPAQCREDPGWPGLVCCPRFGLSAPNGGRIVRPRPARAAVRQQQQAVSGELWESSSAPTVEVAV